MTRVFYKTITDPFLEKLDCISGNGDNGPTGRVSGTNACEVKPHSKPWIVRLNDLVHNKTLNCAGTLISTNVVLTAASCVCLNLYYIDDHQPFKNETTCVTSGVLDDARYNLTLKNRIVGLKGVIIGDHNLREPDEGEMFIEAKQIIGHPDYIIGNLKLNSYLEIKHYILFLNIS